MITVLNRYFWYWITYEYTNQSSKRNSIQKYPRIHLVSLPTRSPELNLLEVRWLWLHRRQAINISTFEDESEIDKAVSDWTRYYNKKHIQSKHKVYRKEASMCLHDLNPIRISSISILLVQTLSEPPLFVFY
jgi:hypothetical protein